MVTSKVAPPHISRLNRSCSRCDTKFGDGQHVVGADARGQQRLVRVAERGVGHQQALLPAGPLGEPLRAQLAAAIWRVPAGGAAESWRGTGGVRDPLRRRLARDGRVAVHDHVAQIGQQLGGAVAARRELEQLRRLVQPAGGDAARLEIADGSPRFRGTECWSSRRERGTRAGSGPCAGRRGGIPGPRP